MNVKQQSIRECVSLSVTVTGTTCSAHSYSNNLNTSSGPSVYIGAG